MKKVTPFCNTWDILGLLYIEGAIKLLHRNIERAKKVITLFTPKYWEQQWDKSLEECGELPEKNKLRREKNEM